MAQRPVLIYAEPDRIKSFPSVATAIKIGDLVKWNGTTIAPLAAATDDDTFVGVSMGECTTAGADNIPVATAGIVAITASSASYAFGAGLKWSAADTVEADGNANTIGWSDEPLTSTRTTVKMFFDVRLLAGKTSWDAMSS